MPISDAEFNSLIARLRDRTQELVSRYPNISGRNTILGNIGEKFVGYCICHSLWRLGYPINFKNSPHSYLLTPKVGADDEGRGGIDFKLTMVDLNEGRYKFLIEAKNWAHYTISPETFRTEILNRFTRLDSNQEYQWIITMNTRNIRYITSRCQEHNIHILPISHHITPESIPDDDIMRSVFSNFIDAFITKIQALAPESAYPTVTYDDFSGDRTQYIMQDLFLAIPYPIIEHRYNVTRGYIARIASYIRSFNVSLPDRRKKNWRLQWEIQE